jgi:hypothetical protein
MKSIKIFCEECNSDFQIDYVDAVAEAKFCPFCAEALDEDLMTEATSTFEWPEFDGWENQEEDDLLKS